MKSWKILRPGDFFGDGSSERAVLDMLVSFFFFFFLSPPFVLFHHNYRQCFELAVLTD